MRSFDIDPDIRQASTMPAWCYRDPAFYTECCERVFARSWQFIVGGEAVRVPQQVMPFTFLEEAVREPLLLARDSEDRLRCLSNVCTHRGALVVDEPGRTAHLRCPYHGRRFGLDGRFQSMPEFETCAGFPTAADDLRQLAMETWGPFHFTALAPAVSFDDWMSPLRNRLEFMPLDQLAYDATRSRDYLVEANWAAYCENYLEGFHVPFVHPALNTSLDYGEYRTDLDRYGSVQVGVSSGGEHVFDLPPDHPDAGLQIAAYYYWLFPNVMFNAYPWGISVNVVRPLSPERTKISFLSFVADPSKLEHGAGAALDRVEREDEVVVESVQRGMRSRLYERGRYSPTREQGVHHFHRLMAEFTQTERH